MNQEQFITLINKTPPVDRSSLDFLQQVATEYPYCQPARILLARNLKEFKKEDFEKQVNQASAYATDRRKFQAILSDRPTVDIPLKRKAPHEGEKATLESQAAQVVIPSKPLPAQKREERKKAPILGWLKKLLGSKPPDKQHPGQQPLSDAMPAEVAVAAAPKVANHRVNAQRQIIERFLQENPRMAIRKELLSDVNLAGKSVADDHELVSETLAQVLAKQGKTQKALEVYRKLSLKYPEKSSYFAKIIEALINENTKH
ncbi:MAG: hypothetical protein R6U64_10385 [Bacteroidales bacterium]